LPKAASEFYFGGLSLVLCQWSIFSIEDCVDHCCGSTSR
jgi:hypothetical protein